MDLQAFKTCITELSDDELMALLADIRTSRRPITDLTTIKEKAKPKARTSGGKQTSIAAMKAALTPEQMRKLLAKLEVA